MYLFVMYKLENIWNREKIKLTRDENLEFSIILRDYLSEFSLSTHMNRAKSSFIVIHVREYHVPVRSKHKKIEIIFLSLKKKVSNRSIFISNAFLLDPSSGEAEKYGNITKEAFFLFTIIIIISRCSLHAS